MNNNITTDISYTNKDFQTIYSELLDVVTQLTNKWDPSLSNESDPGVILLKLNALIADKNNYNIDKNILECFPASVTQESNARNLYEMLGYTMHWYKSARASIGFEVRNADSIPDEGYTLKQFESVTDGSGEYVYTILDNLTLFKSGVNEIQYVDAIEGTVLDYQINNQNLITVSNLDNNLRLYFQDNMIAQNGIFIADATGATDFPTNNLDGILTWKRVDNLATYPLGRKVYQFGVLSNNVCYIEFPQDAMTLMENGVYIKYTVTKGEQGNIKANNINVFFSDQSVENSDGTVTIINDSIRILQQTPITNGEDKETIPSAYVNYKRTMGTFETLVTRRDYKNYILKLKNSNNNLYTSNIVVADRTSDINSTNKIIKWQPSGTFATLDVENGLTAYDILLYPLKCPTSIYSEDTYDDSFKVLTDKAIQTDIVTDLDSSQSSQHDLKFISDIEGTSKTHILNKYALSGSLITYNKVTKNDALSIEKNVLNALYKNYNASKLEFGTEVAYNDLITTIINADARIRNVILNIPEYSPIYSIKKADGNYVESDPYSPLDKDGLVVNELNNELIARMILSGNIGLFKFDTDFLYEFGETTNNETPGLIRDGEHDIIESITSEVTIPFAESYDLKENEVIQILEPSLVTIVDYSVFVKYLCNFSTDADKDYTLKENEEITFSYIDSSNVSKNDTYGAGTIIQPSMNIVSAAEKASISSGQSIKIKGINQTNLTKGTKFYFILNNPTNRLYIEDGGIRILQENEYFIYTNANTTELVILGSGTQLSSENSIDIELPQLDLDKINESDYSNIDWAQLEDTMTITELKITSVAIGGKITKATSTTLDIKNDSIELLDTVVIGNNINDDTIEITPSAIVAIPNRIQSRLLIDANQFKGQELLENQEFTIKLVDGSDTGVVLKSGATVKFSNPVVLSGGNDLDMKVLTNGQLTYSLKGYSFTEDSFASVPPQAEFSTQRDSNGNLTLKTNGTYRFNFNFENTEEDFNYIIPIYVSSTVDNFSIDSNFTIFDGTQTTSTLQESGKLQKTFMLCNPITPQATFNLTISNMEEGDYVKVGRIFKLDGLNTEDINGKDIKYSYILKSEDGSINNKGSILEKMRGITDLADFDWVYQVPDIDKVLAPTTASAYWNVNHIYNSYTIPKIDFTNTKIKVNPTTLI